jgi:hypothetical protein
MISFEALQRFLEARAADLKRIVNGARGELELGELGSEALLMATDIQADRVQAFNFDDPQDQETLLGRLWNRLVKYTPGRFMRNAVRIDDEQDAEDSRSQAAAVARSLSAVETSDPALLLEREEEAVELAARLRDSYSEATAYIHLLRRFDEDRQRLAAFLCVALYTLGFRLRRAAAIVRVQPSVFDGFERVPADFQPTIARERAPLQRTELQGHQWTWTF